MIFLPSQFYFLGVVGIEKISSFASVVCFIWFGSVQQSFMTHFFEQPQTIPNHTKLSTFT